MLVTQSSEMVVDQNLHLELVLKVILQLIIFTHRNMGKVLISPFNFLVPHKIQNHNNSLSLRASMADHAFLMAAFDHWSVAKVLKKILEFYFHVKHPENEKKL